MILICSTPTTPTVGFMACVRACLEMCVCVCVCVCFALVCCALRVDFIKSLRLTNTVIIIIIIIIISCIESAKCYIFLLRQRNGLHPLFLFAHACSSMGFSLCECI